MQPQSERWGWEEWIVLAGVAVGVMAFVVVGVVPALVYGGYAALALLAEITGGPVGPSLASQIFVVCGMVLGFVAVGGLFAVGGAVLGLLGVAATYALLGLARLLRIVERVSPEPATAEEGWPALPERDDA